MAKAEEHGVYQTGNPLLQAQLHYQLAMLYARYLAQKDLAKAEEHLERGAEHLRLADQSDSEVIFFYVFNRNGLAFVRHRQGRFAEAIELCRDGYQELEERLDPNRHRLHKSVLLFNIAQVYAAMGEDEAALAHYSTALEIDPNYSEYFNDRGSTYLRLGRWQAAYDDYHRAIALSAPYSEVYTNLGQCCQLLGRLDEAVAAYSRALDLEPGQVLACLGRAQAHEGLGRSAEALADYDAALALEPDQWEALANRAVLRYEAEDRAGAVADLTRAIELSPQNPDLYRNRSLALADLERFFEAAADLQTFLALSPEHGDRAEVEERLEWLRPSAAPAAPPAEARP